MDVIISSGEAVALRANHVDLHVVNQTKDPEFCDGSGSCKLPLPGAEIRVFDRTDPDFVSAHGKTPAKSDYPLVFGLDDAAPVGIVGACTTDASGTCAAPETVGGSSLVIVYYSDGQDDVFTGKPVSLDADQASDPPANEFQIVQVRRRGGTIQYSGGSKVRLDGSYLEIIYPDFAVWEDVSAGYIYPFIFISDSSWTADVCARVPVGYEITGYFDEDGDFVSDLSCSQTFIEEGSRVIAFEVVDHESPEPQLRARLRVRNPHGVVTVLNLDVPGLRIAAERARGGPVARPALVPSESLPWWPMFDPMQG